MSILIINGSLGGAKGNTAQVLKRLTELLSQHTEVRSLQLADSAEALQHESLLRNAKGFVFASGTYWDSWGSPMQKFFETATEFEATDLWMGKPAATVVTMHSVGGKEVLNRMQGVLSTLGLMIPPMSGLAYSLAGHLALQGDEITSHRADFWSLGDLEIISANLLKALQLKTEWTPWPVEHGDPHRRWI
jgi:multimeric flavodoxin WrbA